MTSFPELTVEQIQEQIRERLADIRPCLRGLKVTIVENEILVTANGDINLEHRSIGNAEEKATSEATA
jgi:hypothetical protein